MGYTVKRVADLASVSVRTLHHYDQIGLIKPATVSPAGYRLYDQSDLEHLQQVLFFRELGFSLKEIKAIVESPDFDRREALLAHRRLLLEQRRRLDRLIESVDQTIASIERGESMKDEEMFEGFDQKQIEEWREEARQRWGSENVDESYRRAAKYTKADWAEIQAETGDYTQKLADLMGRDPADHEVQAQVGRHFRLINERYYNCTPEIFRGLGDLYVDDPRFTAHYEQIKPGLAKFMQSAMHVYADRLLAKG